MTGGLSKRGIVIGCDFSGGITKLPFAAVDAVLSGTGEAAGVGFAEAVSAGAGATTVRGFGVVCAFANGINAHSATRNLPKEKMQDFIGIRERETSLEYPGNAHQREGRIVVKSCPKGSRSLGRARSKESSRPKAINYVDVVKFFLRRFSG